jgi:hypothetical protein
MDWRKLAACLGYPTNWWFPEDGKQQSADVEMARKLCQSCPVADTCLKEHLTEPYGVWGGLGTVQRHAKAGKALNTHFSLHPRTRV